MLPTRPAHIVAFAEIVAYSSYSRGVDAVWGVYQWLDRAPKGRNETGYWWRRHDEYDKR